jgi:hypothetical protein
MLRRPIIPSSSRSPSLRPPNNPLLPKPIPPLPLTNPRLLRPRKRLARAPAHVLPILVQFRAPGLARVERRLKRLETRHPETVVDRAMTFFVDAALI